MQQALELDPQAPADVAVQRLVIPAVPIVKKRGGREETNPQAWPRPGAKVVANHASLYTPTWAVKEMSRIRALAAQSLSHVRAEVPLGIRLTFAFGRPQTHLGASGTVLPRYLERRPISRGSGDIDNLDKLVLDGLTDYQDEPGIMAGDEQVARLISEQWYVDQIGLTDPCTIAEVWEI